MKKRQFSLSAILGVIGILALNPFTVTQTPDFANIYAIGASLTKVNDSPVFIGGVSPQSPADRAGMQAGDRLLAVDGIEVTGLRDAGERTQSDQPGAVTLRLWRRGQIYEVTVEREKRSVIFEREGLQITPDRRIFGLEVTEAEIDGHEEIFNQVDPANAVEAFPRHVPMDPALYSAGFAVVVNPDPHMLIVTGLEAGPGKSAGLREGDVILSINSVDPRGKTAPEIESLLSATGPKRIRLTIRRPGAIDPEKTFEFELQKTEELLKQNHEQLVDGRVLPDWVAEEEMHWFLDPRQ